MIALTYRGLRYHTARVGTKTDKIGYAGLSCEGCDLEMKEERGCQLPGYHFVSEGGWRIDYHDPPRPADLCRVCPLSVIDARPEGLALVEEALDIEQHGGLVEYTGLAVGDLPSWYVAAYDEVMGVKARAQKEAEHRAAQMAAAQAEQQRAQRQAQRMFGGQG